MGILFSHCCGNVQKKAYQGALDDSKDAIELPTIHHPIIYDTIQNTNRRQLWLQYLHIEEAELSKPIRKTEYKAAVNVIGKAKEVNYHNFPIFGSSYASVLMNKVDESKKVDIVTLLTVFNEMNDLPFLPQLIPFVMVLSTQFSTEEIYYIISKHLGSFRYFIADRTLMKQIVTYYSTKDPQRLLRWITTYLCDKVDSSNCYSIYDGIIQSGWMYLIVVYSHVERNEALSSMEFSSWVTEAEAKWDEWKVKKDIIMEENIDSFPPQLCLQGYGRLLTESLHSLLVQVLPKQLKDRTFTTVYSSFEDGYSIMRLLQLAPKRTPTILLLQLGKDEFIGLYREDEWVNRNDSYGTINTYLWHITNNHINCWRGERVEGLPHVIYVRSTNESILIGAGGRKGIALHLSSDFSKGYSEESDVFNNPSIRSQLFFPIQNVELYSISYSCSTNNKLSHIILRK